MTRSATWKVVEALGAAVELGCVARAEEELEGTISQVAI